MYPWIPLELVGDPLGSAQHTLGTTGKKRKGELATGERSGDCACKSYWKNRYELRVCV